MKNEVRRIRPRLLARLGLMVAAVSGALPVTAGPTFITGHISNVTYVSDYVMIRVDAGLPDNCVGTSWGWMKIPPENKAMAAFVTGLWMRGDADQVVVDVYTDGLVGGYCRITQIDPAG